MVWINYFIPAIYVITNVAHAIWHWYRIEKKNELITSNRKTFEYGLACFVLFWSLLTWSEPKDLIIFPILTRMAFYDPFLNIFRKKKVIYEGQISKKKSWVDWIENKIGLPVIFYRVFYLLLYIGYLIYYLIR